MAKTYCRKPADLIYEFFKKAGWNIRFDTENGHIFICFVTKNYAYCAQTIITFEEDFFNVNTLLPMTVDVNDQKTMMAVYEYINRINSELKNGHFELELKGGHIWFRTYVSCRTYMLPKLIIIEGVFCASFNFEKYCQGFADVISGNSSPEEAIAACSDETAEDHMHEKWQKAAKPQPRPEPKPGEKVESSISEAQNRLANRLGNQSDGSEEPDSATVPKTLRTDLFGA